MINKLSSVSILRRNVTRGWPMKQRIVLHLTITACGVWRTCIWWVISKKSEKEEILTCFSKIVDPLGQSFELRASTDSDPPCNARMMCRRQPKVDHVEVSSGWIMKFLVSLFLTVQALRQQFQMHDFLCLGAWWVAPNSKHSYKMVQLPLFSSPWIHLLDQTKTKTESWRENDWHSSKCTLIRSFVISNNFLQPTEDTRLIDAWDQTTCVWHLVLALVLQKRQCNIINTIIDW